MKKAILILLFVPLVSFRQSKYNFLVDCYLSKKKMRRNINYIVTIIVTI